MEENKQYQDYHRNRITQAWKRNISAYRQYRFNRSFVSELDYRNHHMKKLIHAKGFFQIKQPFYCIYGDHIYVGRDFTCGHGAFFEDDAKITIKDHVQIGNHVKLLTAVLAKDEQKRKKQQGKAAEITIEDHVYIGNDVTITAGVTIGRCAVIADGSIVNEDVAPGTLVYPNQSLCFKESETPVEAQNEAKLWYERLGDHVNLDKVDAAVHAAALIAGAYCGYRCVKEVMAKKAAWEEKKALVEKYLPLLEKLPNAKQALTQGKQIKQTLKQRIKQG